MPTPRTESRTMKFLKDYGPMMAYVSIAITIFGVVRSADIRAIDTLQVHQQKAIDSIQKSDTAQDSSIARLNQQTALDRQANQTAFRAIDKNMHLILDELGVPKYRRAHVDSTVTVPSVPDTARDTSG